MGQHVFLTGGTGYLGANVLKRALKQDCSVTMLVRQESRFDQTDAVMGGAGWREQVRCVTAPEPGAFVDWFKDIVPDVVIHTAARGGYALVPSDIQAVIDANITLGAQMLEGLHQLRLRDDRNRPLVFCGTYWQHSAPDGSYKPNSFYAATKTAFEDLASFYHSVLGQRVIGLKFYDTYGLNDRRSRVVDLIVNALDSDTPLKFSGGEQEILPLAIEDGVDAIFSACELLEGLGRWNLTYGVAGPERVTVRQLAALVESQAGRTPNIDWGAFSYREFEVHKPFALSPPPGWTPGTGLASGVKSLLQARGIV